MSDKIMLGNCPECGHSPAQMVGDDKSLHYVIHLPENISCKSGPHKYIHQLESEVERLRGRCGELESNIQQFVCSGTGPVADAENKFLSAVILRKQAEAVDEFLKGWRLSDEGRQYYTISPEAVEGFAQRLRQQAAESDK